MNDRRQSDVLENLSVKSDIGIRFVPRRDRRQLPDRRKVARGGRRQTDLVRDLKRTDDF